MIDACDNSPPVSTTTPATRRNSSAHAASTAGATRIVSSGVQPNGGDDVGPSARHARPLILPGARPMPCQPSFDGRIVFRRSRRSLSNRRNTPGIVTAASVRRSCSRNSKNMASYRAPASSAVASSIDSSQMSSRRRSAPRFTASSADSCISSRIIANATMASSRSPSRARNGRCASHQSGSVTHSARLRNGVARGAIG